MTPWAVVGIVAGAIGLCAASAGSVLRLRRLGGASALRAAVPGGGWSALVLGLLAAFLAKAMGAGFGEALSAFALGAGGGLALFVVLLGWDELADRLWPSFYACLRRETRAFFSTPIPYFVLFLFVLLCGIFFWGNLKFSERVSLRYVFDSVSSIGFFLFPLLTMGLVARERSEGTIEVLMTAPVSETSVTVSKYLGTMVFYGVMLLPTVVYYLVLRYIGKEIGKPDAGPVLSAYFGMLLTGSFFISLGVFVSSLTGSQILSALLSWVLIIIFLLSQGISEVLGLSGKWTGDLLEYVDPLRRHLEPFLSGVIHPKNVVFFLSFTVFFLFLSVRAVEARKWR